MNNVRERITGLLKTWCDTLLAYQITSPRKEVDGAILCPACNMIHGRCPDLIYPLMYLADTLHEDRYLQGALRLFRWGDYVICDDGSMRNDAFDDWRGITVFNAEALADALIHHGHLLDGETKALFEKRLLTFGEWLHQNMTLNMVTNINYFCTNAYVMALLGRYFGRDDFGKLGKELADHAVSSLTKNGLLAGEGQPRHYVTSRGCRPVDIGYNMEESVPALIRYALLTEDRSVLEKAVSSAKAHLAFLLPDGAWDNSFGTRNFKWTYWGSRTSDGCQTAFSLLAEADPVFGEALLRNFELLEKCTVGGLLCGGPHYEAAGEKACIHHAFCHAKALAGVLDNPRFSGDGARCALPCDEPPTVRYWEEIDTYQLAKGPWRATVTGNDFIYAHGGHASGGSLTMLYHERAGPLIAAGMTDYTNIEYDNMQLTRQTKRHRSLVPRVERRDSDGYRAQCYDRKAAMTHSATQDAETVTVCASLVDLDSDNAKGSCELSYELTENGFSVKGRILGEDITGVSYVFPLICHPDSQVTREGNVLTVHTEKADLILRVSDFGSDPEPIFNLCPGFCALECRIVPKEAGEFFLDLTASINHEKIFFIKE